ncbi:DUF4249 domain-containing protein [Pontibacter anaerobius]|uniref:DUF4249 domain-containing protein n=1 Tax=Pontibacter anaerobius TaxID=2993940 RepID=A0ABT3RIG2_9BACT|nr:DUF4249 domain-containing protein [Pontibacter anaerobius]MCX2741647.1 DUF4249 domain-containing protein [Pontibacter anaerobius]
MQKRLLYLLLPLLAILTACDLEKDIDVDLPYHEPQLVVECYLEPGKQIRASVLESSGYFEAPTPPMVPDAEVFVTTPAGKRVQLKYKPLMIKSTGRFYTHTSTEIMNGKPGQVYQLEVTDGKGRKVTGFTIVQPKVPIDEVEWKFNDKDKAYLLTSFYDDANTANYYRYMTHIDSLSGGSDRDFVTSDELTNGKRVSYGSAYDYEENDTLIVTLYHIEQQYYDFISSVSDAKDANGNPFAQPSKIKSSVEGGFGIFTNLAYDRKTVIIRK